MGWTRISIAIADITKMRVDSIVNAANNTLLGGEGVDGAIHRAAGPGLLEECRQLKGCPTGKAVITGGYNLPAAWVIHTVGPIWRGGGQGEDETLARCYKSCLDLAVGRGLSTIAFPSISTGAYGFPLERAAPIAIREIASFLKREESLKSVIMVCHEEKAFNCYLGALRLQIGREEKSSPKASELE